MAAVGVGDKIHVIGGRYGRPFETSDLHEIFDTTTNTWTSGPPLPTGRGGGAGVLYKNMILFMGGEGIPPNNGTYHANEAFDLKSNKWITLSPMPTGRHGFGLAAVGEVAYIITGARGGGSRDVDTQAFAFTVP
jgi:hypothetical protein